MELTHTDKVILLMLYRSCPKEEWLFPVFFGHNRVYTYHVVNPQTGMWGAWKIFETDEEAKSFIEAAKEYLKAEET